MQKIINAIISCLGEKLGDFLMVCAKFAESSIPVLNRIFDRQEKKEKRKTTQEIDDICNSGSLDDLLHKFNKHISVAFAFLLIGCVGTPKVDVVTTNLWEGHFKDEKSFKQATENLHLEKGETIWVLSNRTLSHILQNAINTGK